MVARIQSPTGPNGASRHESPELPVVLVQSSCPSHIKDVRSHFLVAADLLQVGINLLQADNNLAGKEEPLSCNLQLSIQT